MGKKVVRSSTGAVRNADRIWVRTPQNRTYLVWMRITVTENPRRVPTTFNTDSPDYARA